MLKNKFFFFDTKLFKKIEIKKKKNISTWSRSSTILSFMCNKTLFIHNGKRCVPLFIKYKFIGHKLGEFIFTRFFRYHKKKDKSIKIKKK